MPGSCNVLHRSLVIAGERLTWPRRARYSRSHRRAPAPLAPPTFGARRPWPGRRAVAVALYLRRAAKGPGVRASKAINSPPPLDPHNKSGKELFVMFAFRCVGNILGRIEQDIVRLACQWTVAAICRPQQRKIRSRERTWNGPAELFNCGLGCPGNRMPVTIQNAHSCSQIYNAGC